MKFFCCLQLLFFLICTLSIFSVYSFSTSRTIRKKFQRSRRCVCLTITPLCSCYKQPEAVGLPISGQVYREEQMPPVSGPETIPVATPRQQPQLSSPSCVSNCIQSCMQNQYTRCQQSCRNTCQAEQIAVPIASDAVPQQMVPTYSPMQYEPPIPVVQQESPVPSAVQPSSTPVPVVQNSPVIPVVQSNIPYGQSAPSGRICVETCMPPCQSQCVVQSAPSVVPTIQPSPLPYGTVSTPIPVLQQSPSLPQVAPIVEQQSPPISEIPLQNEAIPEPAVPYGNVPYRGNRTGCVTLCMPSCQNQCIQQTTAAPAAVFYHSSSPVPTYQVPPSVLSTVPEQQYPIASISRRQYPEPEPQEIAITMPQLQDCLSLCREDCMQQCVQHGRPAEQCSISCNYACEKNCAQQQQGELASQPNEVPLQHGEVPVQYASPILQPHAPTSEEPQQSVPQQQLLSCSQQSSGVAQCICPAGYQYCKSGSNRGCCRK